jgi:UDP-3-O-[3-hydroxymyristoyl] glucosamine N-acyltransferase
MKTLGEIAAYVGGRLYGDPSIPIKRVVHPSRAQNECDLALVLSPGLASLLASKAITNALVPEGIENCPTPNHILVARPRLALARVLELFGRPVHVAPGVDPSAVIDPRAQIGREVSIGPFCWVGPETQVGDGSRLVSHVSVGAGVQIGEKALLHAGVCIGDRCRIGARVIIQPGALIGGDGFAYVTPEPGALESARGTGEIKRFNTQLVRINSIGNVVIEDDVEIGAGSCVDRGTLGETHIGRSAKLDNLVQVGHNASIGANCLIIAQVGLAGSVQVGDRVVIGGQAGVADHLKVGEDALIQAQSGITSEVPARSIMVGSPAELKRDFLEQHMHLKQLPKILREFKELKEQVAALTERLNSSSS